MKRILLPLLLIVCCLSGCRKFKPQMIDPACFYYCRAEYEFGAEDSVITYELRESGGQPEELSYLLSAYLNGPMDESLVPAFPLGTELIAVISQSDAVTITISDTTRGMTDAEYALGCSCMSMTVMDFLPVSAVTVQSGTRSLTTQRDFMVLMDDYIP